MNRRSHIRNTYKHERVSMQKKKEGNEMNAEWLALRKKGDIVRQIFSIKKGYMVADPIFIK